MEYDQAQCKSDGSWPDCIGACKWYGMGTADLYPGGQSDARLQKQSQQVLQKQVSGTIIRSKDVQVRTLGQDTGEKNRVVLLQTQQGERLVVDLGNKQHLQGLSLQQGMQLQAQGRPVRIGDRPVLLAERITVNGQTQRIQRPERSQARQITGQIQNMKEVNIRGTDRTNKVVLLQRL